MDQKFRLILASLVLAIFLPASSAPGQPAQTSKQHDTTCEITGIVAAVRKVERSPWGDGAPSTMSVFETHILVSILHRRPHDKEAPKTSPCNEAIKKNELARYKLCSSKRPQLGNRIRGTEGGSTGSANAVRCLFDLEILKVPVKTPQPIKEAPPQP